MNFKFKQLLLLLMTAHTVIAQATDSRNALIIGVSEYDIPHVSVPALTGVPFDMESAKKIALGMGIPESNIRYIKNSEATKANILKNLTELGNSAPEGSRTFLYFSGHGTRYMDPSVGGCVEGILSYEGQPITKKEFAEATQTLMSKADKVITLIDACHSQGVMQISNKRSLAVQFTPKFFLKSDEASKICGSPANQRTRGLVAEGTRLGALQENVVEITSSRPDEVSFDEPGKGGLATQGVRDCLLGQAKDQNSSGAVTMQEVQQCAQEIINNKLQGQLEYTPHHITVSGNRNLIPVQKPPTPVQTQPDTQVSNTTAEIINVPSQNIDAPQKTTGTKVSSSHESVNSNANTLLESTSSTNPHTENSSKPAAEQITEISTNQQNANSSNPVVSNNKPQQINSVPQSTINNNKLTVSLANTNTSTSNKPSTETLHPEPDPILASMTTINLINQQRNPKRQVIAKLSSSSLKIGKDSLDISIKTNHDGYIYLIMLGSDNKSFYVLYPNGLDDKNRIEAGKTTHLPKANWQVQASGPEGQDNILVMVSDSPRKLSELEMAKPTASEPFTYALNNIGGRRALLDFLIGNGVDGKSESFGSALLTVKEIK